MSATAVATIEDKTEIGAVLAARLGPDRVRTDEATRRLRSEDLWRRGGSVVVAVVAPVSVEELSACAAICAANGHALAPRGAGMSYTSGYVPTERPTVSVDLSAMDRIVAIDPDAMTVTVQAGCRWATLHAALARRGLRTPFWGPMSGLTSTVGGGVSQLNAMFGAGKHGTTSESVVALTVVLGDGRVLRTGARGPDGASPFYRHHGPDLAGLFCGDCGAFGIKAEITLRLIPMPAHEGHASFAFATGPALLGALAKLTRAGIASESCGFDAALSRLRLARASVRNDLRAVAAVARSGRTRLAGLRDALNVVRAGRSFVRDGEFPLHVVVEGRSAAAVAADMAALRRIMAEAGGRETENSVARVLRAMPFPPLNSVLGPQGERWVPIHAITSPATATLLWAEIEALRRRWAREFADAEITTGTLFTHLSTNAILIEPVFFWPEERFPLHETAVEAELLARMSVRVANPEATEIVARAREDLLDLFGAFGCAHFQIGRTYPYWAGRDAASRDLLRAVKQAVDPDGLLNPGVLGLE